MPLDGIVVSGSSAVDESSLTGESKPISKTVDDHVSAGTLNQGGYLEIVSSKLSKDSCVTTLSTFDDQLHHVRCATESLSSDAYAIVELSKVW